jgi:CBS domain-containing protein
VSPYQQRRRVGHVEGRAHLPIASVLASDPSDGAAATARRGDTLNAFFAAHVALARRRAVAVLDDGDRYEGMVFLDDVLTVEPERWATTTVGEVMRTDAPVGRPDWTIGQALGAMLAGGVEHLPVVDGAGVLHGVAGTADILDLDDLLGRLEPGPDDTQL